MTIPIRTDSAQDGRARFRNSFDHESHNLPNLTEAETLEHLFVASYMLRIIDQSVSV